VKDLQTGLFLGFRTAAPQTLFSTAKGGAMAKDLTITGWGEDRPGINADIGEALGRAGVNIAGTFGSGKVGEIHVLVEDVEGARRAIAETGFTVSEERDVVLVQLEDRPGAWGDVARRIADAGVNIDYHYVATGTRIVVVPDDVERAREAVGAAAAVV
jgi:hypothetical protein